MKIIYLQKRLMWFLVTCIPVLVNAQGIQWIQGLFWEQVKQKAKQENKYIFVDAYATWCGPCKLMDKNIYSNENVGSIVNKKFIAIKVQMDSTENDDTYIRQWYPVVRQFQEEYHIAGYPSFLFFSPNGEIVHQDLGYKSVDDFISLVIDASDSLLSNAGVLDSYKKGDRRPQVLLKAAKAAKQNGDRNLANSIADEYKEQYLDLLPDKELFTKPNIQFVAQDFPSLAYKEGIKGRIFQYMANHPEYIDSVYNQKGFSKIYISTIITSDELNSKLFVNNVALVKEPDWGSIKTDIFNKYHILYADEIVEDYKPSFYIRSGNWKAWAKLFEEKVNRNKMDKDGHHLGEFSDDVYLNEQAWAAFTLCTDEVVLNKALRWVNLAIKLEKNGRSIPQYYDTKANLLYKLGKKKKAIKFEKLALKWDNYFAQKKGKVKGAFAEEFSNNIKKMQVGVPTWKDSK